MKKQIAFAILLASTGIAVAQTVPPDDVRVFINSQITDAVTQLHSKITDQQSELEKQIDNLELKLAELQSTVNEYERRNAIINSRTLFVYDSVEMTADSAYLVKDVLAFMKDFPNYDVLIEGHTDERGTREYNLALGERRAFAMRDFLIANGIDVQRIKTVSYGKERPAMIGSTESVYQQNRRGYFYLSK